MPKLYERLRNDIVTAVKARESTRAIALRTIDGAIQRAALDKGTEITDELVLTVLRKNVKDLENARDQFAEGGRQDLVEKNTTEIAWLSVYLPAPMSEEALDAIVAAAIAESGAASPKEMGKVMGQLKRHPQSDQIDFGAANRIIREKLS